MIPHEQRRRWPIKYIPADGSMAMMRRRFGASRMRRPAAARPSEHHPHASGMVRLLRTRRARATDDVQ
jgi:hypothetical protein